jgi:site-specific recombinase XerD
MAEPRPAASFPILLQRFLGEHMTRHRAASPCTVAAYKDTFRLLLLFAEQHIGKAPTAVTLADLDAQLIPAFLHHLEHDRGNGARSRNARLAAIRSFLRYAVHHDLSAMVVIEQALAVPMKRFDRPLLGHLDRAEMQAILDAPDRRSWAGNGPGAADRYVQHRRASLGDSGPAPRRRRARHDALRSHPR